MRYLFGLQVDDLQSCAESIAQSTNIEMKSRESDYLGIYFCGSTSELTIDVVLQPDPEGEPMEPEFEQFHVLVYVEAPAGFELLDDLCVEDAALVRLK